MTVCDPAGARPAKAAHISCRGILLDVRQKQAQYRLGSVHCEDQVGDGWREGLQKEDFRAAGG